VDNVQFTNDGCNGPVIHYSSNVSVVDVATGAAMFDITRIHGACLNYVGTCMYGISGGLLLYLYTETQVLSFLVDMLYWHLSMSGGDTICLCGLLRI
jgi:hypothetical protein